MSEPERFVDFCVAITELHEIWEKDRAAGDDGESIIDGFDQMIDSADRNEGLDDIIDVFDYLAEQFRLIRSIFLAKDRVRQDKLRAMVDGDE